MIIDEGIGAYVMYMEANVGKLNSSVLPFALGAFAMIIV